MLLGKARQTVVMQTSELTPEVRRALKDRLPELCTNLMLDEAAGVDDLDVTTRLKGNGVILVEARAKPTAGRPHSPATATFELQPSVQDGEVTYRGTEVDSQTGGI